jgi:putative glutamine amidotransferase
MALIAIAQNRKMEDYLESLRRAGGEPIEVVLGAEDPGQLLSRVDGLMLTGGGDVDPALYGETANATFEAAETGRDAFEIALARAAVKRGIPLLAICRGMQVLNVAMGGTLVQDIPSEITGALEHSVPQPRFHIAHEVWVSKDSRLATLLADHMEDGETCHVNSRHHQSVKHAAEGFDIIATSPDGVIEAMEKPDAAYCIAVQWHPENFWRTGEFRELFEGLVQASTARKR